MRPARRRGQAAGQALVEFVLVAPIVLLLIGATVDIGRGLLLYTLLQGASRDTARQATLAYYNGSNNSPPDCTALATPCSLSSIVTGAHALDSLGVTVMYSDSATTSTPPAYGGYAANSDTTLPGTITLSPGDASNIVYVFIYELDSNAVPVTRWGCTACGPVRTTGHQWVVVDLKLKWQPVLARFLGIPASVTFDSQTVDRLEF